jgi:hypothetical protein
MNISEKTLQQIESIDNKINSWYGYDNNEMKRLIESLRRDGYVEVGWRTQCGSTDRTQKVYREWCKVIKMLSKDGIRLSEESVKHKNAYATNNGGFWNSIIYKIAS